MPLPQFAHTLGRRLLRPLQHALAGSQCLVCRQWQAHSLCTDCITAFAAPQPRCRACAMPSAADLCADCLRAPPPWSRVVTAVEYGHPWDRLLLALKFGDQPEMAAPLARLLAETICRAQQHDGLDRPDLIVPMPLSEARLRERGHNQAWVLAQRLVPVCGGRAEADLLWRVRDTPHQLALSRAERAGNVRGAFVAAPELRQRHGGCRIALVDDVMTTGASAAEAAAALLRGGAAEVQVWVVARAP